MTQSPGASAADQARRILADAQALAAAGRVEEAEGALAAAETLHASSPHDADPWTRSEEFLALMCETYERVGRAHLARGGVLPALGHLAEAVALGADEAVQTLFISLMLRVRFQAPPPSPAKWIVQRALEERWIDPGRLGRLAAALLAVEPGARDLARALETPAIAPDLLAGPAAAFLREPLLLALLDSVVVVDPHLERVLGVARRALLRLATSAAPPQDEALERFAAALANQGFANEYAWPVCDPEAADVEALRERCAQALAGGQAPEPLQLAMVAAYRPLRSALDPAALAALDAPPGLATTILRQVREPAAEDALKGDIPVLTDVDDPGSQAVRRQYEENPYPRWVSAPARRQSGPFLSWIAETFPASAGRASPPADRHEVLVAGCGTGIETVALVQTFSDVEVLAIDLSLASLAHARRRAAELGLDHLAFAQADLLEFGRLGRRFDVVVSAGVLHHLDDPRRGLEALRDATRPGGLLMLGLYSRLARRFLEPARAFARENGFDATADGLRRFRAAVLAMAEPAPAWRDGLLQRDDFYSLSSLRDLLFHVREAVFDPAGIASMLQACGLDFLGFEVPPEAADAFADRFGAEADPLSLEQWGAFEADRPDTFSQMYYFLAQRPPA